MPILAAVASVWTLAAVVAARQLLVGERLLLVAPFHLALSACSAGLAGVLVGHSGTVETGCDSHACHGKQIN